MIAKKITSASTIHDRQLAECPVSYTIGMIGGRWKTIILYQLRNEPLRFGQLKRMIPAITEKMLVQQLKQLENDRLIVREAKEIVPPHVLYYLSESGKTLLPILMSMAEWGRTHNPNIESCP